MAILDVPRPSSLREIQVNQVGKDLLVSQVPVETTEHQEGLGHKDHKEKQEIQELMEIPGHPGNLEPLGHKDQQDPMDSKAFKEIPYVFS